MKLPYALALLAAPLSATLLGCGDGASLPPVDAPVDASSFETCEGSCQTTALTATFAATRVLDRALYGITQAPEGTTLHVEAYRGGAPGCPEMDSPPPEYALILGMVPVPTSTDPITSSANLLDYSASGDLLGGALGVRATDVVITPVAARLCPSCVGQPTPSDPDGMVALDVTLTFPGGTVTGHLYATHCDSFDLVER